MNSYLKYKHPLVQLLIVVCLTCGIVLAISLIAVLLISKIFQVSQNDFETMNLSKPGFLSALKTLQVVMSVSWFLVPSLVFAYLSDSMPLKYLGFRNPVPASFLLVSLLVILAAIPMVTWLMDVNQHMHLPKGMEEVEKLMHEAEQQRKSLTMTFLKMNSVSDLLIMLFIMAILPAVAEEMFFRGVLQRLLIQITTRPWTGIIITAILFSALHGQFLGFFPRMVLGIVLGALYWYSGSLWPGILAHFINNGLQIILIYYNPNLVDKEPDFSAWLIAGSTFFVIGLTWWMHRVSQTSFAEVYDTDDDFPIGPIGPRDKHIA